SKANHRFELCRSYGTTNLPASSACNGSGEDWAGVRAPLCFRAQKSWRMARSRRRGLSFLDRAQAVFPGCVARAALKASLGEDPTERWIIGSSDAATIGWHPMRRIVFVLLAVVALAGLVAYMVLVPGQANGEASPIYGIKIPAGYRY